ncbi:MAG TPA: hypothetical protein VFJ85_03470 [Acidimicrobiales bacterium]|nr:hypothetical protein [Acidimicrobiales bacterium]
MPTVRIDVDDAGELASGAEFVVGWINVLGHEERLRLPLDGGALAAVQLTFQRLSKRLCQAEFLP